jgi:hypothetical protein
VLRVIVVRTITIYGLSGGGWSSRVRGSVVTPPAPTPLLLVVSTTTSSTTSAVLMII